MKGSLARRYAKALFAIGQEDRLSERMAGEWERWAQLLQKNPALVQALSNARFPLNQRLQLLRALCARLQCTPPTHSALLLLLERGHIAHSVEIARALRSLVDAQMGLVRIRVVAARTIDLPTELRLQVALEQALGKKVLLEKAEDPSLLGGAVVRVGDVVIDGSIATQLAMLREQIAHSLQDVTR